MALNIHAKEIKVVTEYLTPYQVKNADGSLGGYSTEVINALFKQANITPNFLVMPWVRAYEIAKSEKNVMIFSIAHTKSRNDLFHWIGCLTNEKLYFWGLKNKFHSSIELEALLKGYSVTASRNSNISQYLSDANFFNIYYITVEDQSMKMLFSNRIDLLIDTEINAKYRATSLGLDFSKMQKVIEINKLNYDLSIAMNANSDPQLVKEFQLAYSVIKAQGIIEALKKKWSIPH
jgi:polar amino acid transport system substrate-binding protein